MINIGKILKRSWEILWNYKALWIFGFLLAMTAGSGSSGGNSSYQFNGNNNNNQPPFPGSDYQPGPAMQEFIDWFEETVVPVVENPGEHVATIIWIGVALLVFILIVGTITSIVRYVSETALLRMVDEYEQTGTKLKFKAGWKLGWNRRAFRMWVIDLIISLPVILFLLLLGLLGLAVYSSVNSGAEPAAAMSVVAGAGCAFLIFFLFFLGGVFLTLLRHFFVRVAALDGAGIGASLRDGWALFKRNWKSAALLWLVMLGIGIGFGIASMILFFVLIPVMAVMLIPAVIVAGIPGLIVFGIGNLFTGTIGAVIIAIIAVLPLFMMIVVAPLTLIGGWFKVFEANVWTLTYREMKALESLSPVETAPEISAELPKG